MEFVISTSGKGWHPKWRLEVKGLSTGRWVQVDESERRTKHAAEREMRRGPYGWTFDKREWRIGQA